MKTKADQVPDLKEIYYVVREQINFENYIAVEENVWITTHT
jgi:hypothetical protein